MKKIFSFLFVFVFLGFFVSTDVFAPAVVLKEGNVFLVTDFETVPATTFMWVKTPSNSRLLKLTWQLSEGNPLIPDEGVNKISVGGWLARDVETLVFPDGMVKGVFHVNGAGDITPNPGNK